MNTKTTGVQPLEAIGTAYAIVGAAAAIAGTAMVSVGSVAPFTSVAVQSREI